MISKLQNLDKKWILIFSLVAIFLFKVFIATRFNNSDWEPDSFMHFLELKTVFTDFPNNLSMGLGVWTKPLYAYPLGFLVQIFNIKDLFFVEIINILISLLISFIVFKIVYKLTVNFKIALFSIFLCAFSLTLFKSSVSTLTDQIFGLMLILNLYLALQKRYKLASLFVGLSVIGRIEGLFFVGIYNLWLILELTKDNSRNEVIKKLLINWVITLIPVFIWNFLGAINSGLPLFVIQGGYPSKPGVYGYGGYFSYPRMFLIQDLIVTLLFSGATLVLARKFKEIRSNWFLFLVWGSFTGFFLVEAILWKLGIFGSAGLMRYFVGVIPYMIIVSGFGIYKVLSRFDNLKQKLILSAFIILQFGLLIMHLSGIGFTKSFPAENNDFKLAGEWIKQNISEDEFMYSDRPEAIYYSGRNLTNSANRFGEEFDGRNPGVYVWSKEWGKDVYGFDPDDFKDENVIFNFDDRIIIIRIDSAPALALNN